MKYTEPGTYYIEYSATDSCGNESEVVRTVIVNEVYDDATVLYTDGTLVINSLGTNRQSEIAQHGAVVAEYPKLDANNPYVLSSKDDQPWANERDQIQSVEFGSEVAPTSLEYWLQTCTNLADIDWTNFDGSNVTSMRAMFQSVALTSITLPPMPNLESMRYVFNSCESLTSVDFSQVGSNKISNMAAIFQGASAIEVINLKGVTGTVLECQNMFSNASASAPATNIKTIYAEQGLDFSQATNSINMFRGCTQLVGGQGTVFDSSKTDNAYAKIDGGSADKGYFTQAS